MKKFLACFLCLALACLLVSCGKEKTPFDIAANTLAEANMSKTEYSDAEIRNFEERFAKMGLEKGFSKVCRFALQTQYAYLIEFESADDAAIFYSSIVSSDYDLAQSENVVVYGHSTMIGKIPFDR